MRAEGKIAAITGATGAIGKAIARQMAMHGGYKVVLLCRDENRAKNLVRELQQETGNNNIDYKVTDLSLHSSVQTLSENWQGPLHVLINNAATTPIQREVTVEGIERQWATNVLGYFWMMHKFSTILKASAPARIVNVASYWAGELDLRDPEFKNRRYNNNTAYRQSKQADRMLTAAFAERLSHTGITVNACHPGDVNSRLSNDLGFGGHETPDEGADTPVWLATDPQLTTTSGKYFERRKETKCHFAANKREVDLLMQLCESY
ncbi:MAG: SDR family NAD(P)-dependent oxidoreductase [Deferribacteres bacterium]|nr:SDR family NAD(P)-dependent oxidoreductase [candidate division KSB1 bacterium]MCB9503409.1 SDR family NAD(P)-dependent oxidoreductase [Deferribacteres bacterium]